MIIIEISETLKAISDPIRRNILEMLKKGKMTAGDIAKEFNITNASVSYHLSYLKRVDLIREENIKTIFTMNLIHRFLKIYWYGFINL